MDEQLQEKLKELEQEREECTGRILELTRQEKDLEKQLQELMEQEDVGVEVFSPRSSAKETQQKISWIKKNIEEVHIQQLQTQNRLEENAQKSDQYQKLLLELRNQTEIESIISQPEDKTSSQAKDDLENLLKRVDKCLNYIHSDRVKCKNELRNMHYYLKALITKYSS